MGIKSLRRLPICFFREESSINSLALRQSPCRFLPYAKQRLDPKVERKRGGLEKKKLKRKKNFRLLLAPAVQHPPLRGILQTLFSSPPRGPLCILKSPRSSPVLKAGRIPHSTPLSPFKYYIHCNMELPFDGGPRNSWIHVGVLHTRGTHAKCPEAQKLQKIETKN